MKQYVEEGQRPSLAEHNRDRKTNTPRHSNVEPCTSPSCQFPSTRSFPACCSRSFPACCSRYFDDGVRGCEHVCDVRDSIRRDRVLPHRDGRGDPETDTDWRCGGRGGTRWRGRGSGIGSCVMINRSGWTRGDAGEADGTIDCTIRVIEK